MRAAYLAPFAFAIEPDRARARRRHAARREGPLPADRLSGGHGAAGHHHDHPLRLQNYGLAPERLQLSVDGVPQGWTATLLGGGQPVAAAMPATNDSVSLQLRLDVPEDAADGHADHDRDRQGQAQSVDAAGRGLARQGFAGQAHARAASCRRCAAPRSRPSNISSPSRTTAAQSRPSRFAAQAPPNFETSLHRAVRQPGARPRSRSMPASPRTSSSRCARRAPSTPASYTVTVKVSAEDATADHRARRSRSPASRSSTSPAATAC